MQPGDLVKHRGDGAPWRLSLKSYPSQRVQPPISSSMMDKGSGWAPGCWSASMQPGDLMMYDGEILCLVLEMGVDFYGSNSEVLDGVE